MNLNEHTLPELAAWPPSVELTSTQHHVSTLARLLSRWTTSRLTFFLEQVAPPGLEAFLLCSCANSSGKQPSFAKGYRGIPTPLDFTFKFESLGWHHASLPWRNLGLPQGLSLVLLLNLSPRDSQVSCEEFQTLHFSYLFLA